MYAYTLQIPAPPDVYLTLHRAVVEVVNEGGGGDGLILHLVRETDNGCELTEVWESKDQLDDFNNTVFPKAVARSGVLMDGPAPELVEFNPLTLVTPRAFTSDSQA
jgi:hypothetical protein